MSGALANVDLYDYLALAALIVLAVAFFAVAMFILALPGKIAYRRNHPHAEAVKLMGWVGFLAIVPWIHALIWAYHDGVTVDIRRDTSGAPEPGRSGPGRSEPPGPPPSPPRPAGQQQASDV